LYNRSDDETRSDKMSMTSGGSIGAAFPGANNVVGQVSAVLNRGASEGLGGTVAVATEDYPHHKNGSNEAYTGPINQPTQLMGHEAKTRLADEHVPLDGHPVNTRHAVPAYPIDGPVLG
jgi:hypothetical protein